jgi:hypothetical protein
MIEPIVPIPEQTKAIYDVIAAARDVNGLVLCQKKGDNNLPCYCVEEQALAEAFKRLDELLAAEYKNLVLTGRTS